MNSPNNHEIHEAKYNIEEEHFYSKEKIQRKLDEK